MKYKLKIAPDTREGGEMSGSPGVLEVGAGKPTSGDPMLSIPPRGLSRPLIILTSKHRLGMERRKYPRVDVDLRISYLIHSPDSGKSFAGTGVLKNINPGGMFLKCPQPLPISDGDTRNFTIDTMLIMQHSCRLKVLGKVVRKEPKDNSFDFEIRVHFLSDLNVEFRKVGDLALNQGKQA